MTAEKSEDIILKQGWQKISTAADIFTPRDNPA
jgi:hypothetical protein